MSLNVPLVVVVDEAKNFHNVEMRCHGEPSTKGTNVA